MSWKKDEARVAAAINGSLVAGSGCSPMGGRGDVRTGRYLVEVKTTNSKRYRITKKLLDKTEQRATKEGLEPALVVVVRGRRWVAVLYHKGSRTTALLLGVFEQRAREEGVRLKGTDRCSLGGDPWVIVPFVVFQKIAKGGNSENKDSSNG